MSHHPPPNPANAPSLRFFPRIGIGPASRVLDVGCGNGDLSRLLAAQVGPGGEVVGIDRSEGALAAADAVPPQPGSAPIRYRPADLGGELPDLGVFDAIVGRRVLMYLPDAAATLGRLARLARPGTILAFQEHARGPLPTGVDPLPAHARCYGMMWDKVAAEGGDVTLGYRLGTLVRDAGFVIDQTWGEAVLIQPGAASFLPTLLRVMHPRMVEHGIAGDDTAAADKLAAALDEEHRATTATIVWDLAFCVSGRFTAAG